MDELEAHESAGHDEAELRELLQAAKIAALIQLDRELDIQAGYRAIRQASDEG